MISVYSFATSVIIYNLALILVYLLRRWKTFLFRYGTQALLLISVLGVIRLFSPVDLERAYVITSTRVLPVIEDALKLKPLHTLQWLSIGKLIATLWLLGSCCFAAKYAIQTARAIYRRKRYISVYNEEVACAVSKLGVRHPVIFSPQVSTPHTAGFLKPAIYLPALEMTEKEWEYILRHEMRHIYSHDTWIKLFYCLIETVFWWNPVSHLFMRELDALLELRCDANVISELSKTERVQYLTTMIDVLNRARPKSCAEAMSAGFAANGNDLKQRFEAVLQYGRALNRKARNMIYTLVLLLFCLSYFVVVQPAYSPHPEDLYGTYEVTEDTAFILFDEGKYWLYINGQLLDEIQQADLKGEPYSVIPVIEIEGD